MLDNTIEQAIRKVAVARKIEPAALLAVVEVESAGVALWDVGGEKLPPIRFEGHYFYARLSGAKLDRAIKEGLAAQKSGVVKNPTSYAARYAMLKRAADIDLNAAYESTSWGLGQVMGANWKSLGYDSIVAFRNAASTAEGQIDMMVRFILVNHIDDDVERKDWTGFARVYNGPQHAKLGYHRKLEAAYKRWKGATASSVALTGTKGIQTMLNKLGYKLKVDGVLGEATLRAIKAFQKNNGLKVDGIVGPITKELLEKLTTPTVGTKVAIPSATGLGTAIAVEIAKQTGVIPDFGFWPWVIIGGLAVVAAVVFVIRG